MRLFVAIIANICYRVRSVEGIYNSW